MFFFAEFDWDVTGVSGYIDEDELDGCDSLLERNFYETRKKKPSWTNGTVVAEVLREWLESDGGYEDAFVESAFMDDVTAISVAAMKTD